MASKEFYKLDDANRKEIGKNYGFKRSGYISYKIVDGYFFALYHLVASEAFLKVKPMYADDLWWDIFQCPDNKKAPKSLRGTGAFSVSATLIASYPAFTGSWKQYTEEMINCIWQNIFQMVEKDIESFITAHPDPNKYFPEPKYKNGCTNLLYILALLQNGSIDDATNIIKEAMSKGECYGMGRSNGSQTIDGYEYILDWINQSESQSS